MTTKLYTYKVVGVTFRDRQKNLKSLFNASVRELKQDEWLSVSYDVELRPYEYEGEPAIAVYLDDKEVGNVAADKVADVLDMLKKEPTFDAEIKLNNNTPEEYVEMLSDKDLYEDELDEIKEDPIYSATIDIYYDDGEPDPVRAPAPDPEPREYSSVERHYLKVVEKARRKEEKRAAKEAKKEAKRAKKRK